MTRPREGVARVLLVVAGVAAIVGLVVTGCESCSAFWLSSREHCQTACGSRGYTFTQEFGSRPQSCECGTAADGGAGAGR